MAWHQRTSRFSCPSIVVKLSERDFHDFKVYVVQSLSNVRLFSIPWTTACQASLSFIIHVYWAGDAIQQSHPLLPSILVCLQSFPASRSFPMSLLFASGGQSIRASTSASVLPKSSQGWFPLRLTSFISLLSKGLSRVFSSTTVWKHLFFGALPSLFPCSHVRTWWLERP